MQALLFGGGWRRLSGLALSVVLLGVARSACAADAPAAGAKARPNIVFIFADDHAAHAISAYGSKINKTPQIDRIAQQGMRFENCLCTNSICGPSRAVVLTGKFSHLNGFRTNHDRFDGGQQTMPKLMQQAGYQTAMIGKWHLVSNPTGFDHWEILQGQGTYYNPRLITPQGTSAVTGYTTDILTDHAIKWLDEGRDKNKPFLLMMHHKAPHRNWQPAIKNLNLYEDVEIPEPSNFHDDYQGRAPAAAKQKMEVVRDLTPNDLKLTPQMDLGPKQRAAWDAVYGPRNEAFRKANLTGEALDHWKYERYMKDYLRTIASVDESVGRVLDYLDKNGLADNTIVIYSSDQGFYLGDHGWFDKRWMYEESLRMPMVVRWPGVIKPGSVNRDLVQNLDFAETFLDAAGAPIPPDMQGASLLPLLRGKTPADWRKSIYYHYYEFPAEHSVARHYGVRDDRYKLIYYYQDNAWELFDLKKDPNEMKSVYGDAAYADVQARLKTELERLRTLYKDTKPDNETIDKRPKK